MKPSGRLLALVGHAYGASGGIAQYNRDFLGGAAQAGLAEAVEILPRRGSHPVATPAGIVQRRPRFARSVYAARALARGATGRFDVVFCGHLYMAPLAAAVARLAKAKLVVQTHGVEAWPRPSAAQRAAVERADLVLSVSRHTRARVLDWAAIEPERLMVTPDTVREDFTPGDGSALRRRWGLEGRRVLLTVARMDPGERYKGQDRVIRTLPRLIEAGHEVVYVIVGEGADRTRLERLATDTGVAERVRFTGAVDDATLIEAYRMADLFVMPSTGEGFGISFLQAMACGLPAIGLADAGARDALGDGALGIATTEADLPERLEQALAGCVIAASPQEVRRRFGKAAFARELRHVFERLDG